MDQQKNERIKYAMALRRRQATKYMQQPTKNMRAPWGRDRIRSATVGERGGGAAFDCSGADELEGGVE